MSDPVLKRLFLAGLAFCLAANVQAGLEVPWFTLDCGGVMQSNGNGLELSGTIAQPDAGPMTGGTLELAGGFWPGSEPEDGCPGDVNGNGSVNLTDVAMLLGEFGCSVECIADVDADGDTDISDLAIVLGNYGCS